MNKQDRIEFEALRKTLAAEQRAAQLAVAEVHEAREATRRAVDQRDAATARAVVAEQALAAVQRAAPISDADLDRLIALLGPYGAFATAPRSFGGPPSTQLMRDVCVAVEAELRRRGVLPFTPADCATST